jgi:hypothetical protein
MEFLKKSEFDMNCLPKIDQKVIFRFAEVGLNTIIVSDKKKQEANLKFLPVKSMPNGMKLNVLFIVLTFEVI